MTENPRVGGSIPSLGTRRNKGVSCLQLAPFFFVRSQRRHTQRSGSVISNRRGSS